MKFKDIQFGRISAEAELDECPNLLINGFIDDDNVITKIINGNMFLVYGLKGSGKSAIGAKIKLESQKTGDILTRYCNLEDLDYNMFKQFDSKKGSAIEMYGKNWSTILLISLLDLMERNKNHITFSKSANNSITFLKNANVLPSDRISSIVNKASKKNIDLKIIQFSSEESITPPLYDQLNEHFKDAVLTCSSDVKQILMIDGLDGVATFRESQYEILTSLLQTTDYLNRLLRENKVNIKIVLFCRTDFLDKMNGSNTEKIIDNYGYQLSWFQEGVEAEKVNLIRLLNLRAEIQTNIKNIDIFEEYSFPQIINNKEIRKYLLDHTRHIPRDIIKLISFIQKQCTSDYISSKNIETAVRNYSNEYFYGEVRDELCGFVKIESIEEMFKLFRGLNSYETSMIELQKESDKNAIKINLQEILSILFDIGAIGNFKIVGTGVKRHKRYYFKYRERYASFNPNEGIIIHLALQHALKMKGMSSNSIIDITYEDNMD